MPQIIYEIKNLKHRYNKDSIALDIDYLSINTSSIIGLSGPNGSGKSTLLKMLGFIEKPSEGNIIFKGEAKTPSSKGIRLKTVSLPQKSYLLKRSVYKNLLYGLKIRKDTEKHKDRIHEALSLVGLSFEEFAFRQWNNLSGGETQRVALAARLILKPEVLLLDEPTSNVDVWSSHLIKKAVLNAKKRWGTTLVIASHDREWLSEVCDEIIYLFNGKLFKCEKEVKKYMDLMLNSCFPKKDIA
ncbi:MAG: energy-coupling factor ABC transporter ATP-binding protein [Desulfobacterales bacterium]|nr:energy-coupling factor ABC transporter ATP-binding protein [Desulfobacterales bacterium]